MRRFIRFLILVYLLYGFSVAYSHVHFGPSRTKLLTQGQKKISQQERIPTAKDERLVSTSETVIAQKAGFGVRLPVLMYHYIRAGVPSSDKLGISLSVTPAAFEEQMRYLSANGYYSVTPADLYSSLKSKTTLPPKAIILTFDDGYRDFYTNAYPILKKYGFRSTIFMIVDWVGRDGYLTSNQLLEMQASGLVDVESHTLNHADLPILSLEKAREEIFASKTKLEAFLGKQVSVFCYPYGAYNSSVAKMVADAGYLLAFTTRNSQFENEAETFYLPRVRIDGTDSFATFFQKVS